MNHVRLALRFASLVLTLATPTASANVVGGDMQNFNPTTDGLDFVSVHSSETLDPGIFNLGLFVNNAVNSLPYFEGADGSQSKTSLSDQLIMRDLSVGVGVIPDLEVGFSQQFLMKQTVDDDLPRGEFTGSGTLNYRALVKYRLFGDSSHGVAVIGTSVINLLRDNPYIGRGGSNIRIFEVAGDTTVHDIAVGVNLGYRSRERGDPIPGFRIQPTGDQLIGSAGMSYLLKDLDTKLIVEVFAARPSNPDRTGQQARQASSAELLGGFKWDVMSSVSAHAGAGTELVHGASSPDWRLYAGVNWAFGPVYDYSRMTKLVKDVTTGEETTTLFNIGFAFGSDEVPKSAEPELTTLAQEIKAVSYKKIVLEGHTDSVGREEANKNLSERRANAVRQWLIDHGGLDGAKLEAVGYGETRPIADNGNYQGRQRNRRVQVRVTR